MHGGEAGMHLAILILLYIPNGDSKKERGAMDNVYILDHLTKNQLNKKGGRMYQQTVFRLQGGI
jgi:hypothetical protein